MEDLSFQQHQNSVRSNDALKKMKKNQLKYNDRFSEFYKEFYDGTGLNLYKRKAERMKECFRIQSWDMYENNKILDNTAHFRCKNRFCLNCQILINSYHAFRLKPFLNKYELEGYKPYMLTLTVPNCRFEDLRETIKKMNMTYNKLFKKFNADDKRAFGGRLIKIDGSIKVLEVTVNHETQTFHPHFHILVLVLPDKNDMDTHLKHNIQGRYSYKKKSHNMHCPFGIQIMKIWSMLWYGKSIHKKYYDSWPNDPGYSKLDDNGNILEANLEVNFQPFMSKLTKDGKVLDNNTAFAELIKYTVEFSEINSKEIFWFLETQLVGLRRIQGSGILAGILKDINEDDPETEGEIQDLNLFIKEDPQHIITKDLKELYTNFSEFVKLYRRNTSYDKDVYNEQINKL